MLDKQKLEEKCKKILSKIMKVSSSKITDKTSADNVDSWDSLSHVQLVSALEKNFKIKVSPEEWIDSLNNFRQIVQLVSKKIKK